MRRLGTLLALGSMGFGLWAIWWPLCPTVLGFLLWVDLTIEVLTTPRPTPPQQVLVGKVSVD